MSATENGVTTYYSLDLNAGLTQVLQDGETTYLYGNGRIGQFAGADSAYFLGDALGSVRQLVDEEGTVTLAKTYEPYGEVLISMGTGVSAYGFTGEMQKDDLVYLRARFYSSYLNRFIQADTNIPDPYKPADWNLYIYAWNNPIRYSDPTGKRPLECYPDEPGCNQGGRWSFAEHFLWVPGDIVLSSTGKAGLLGYWSHAFGIIATWPKENGVRVIALPPWEGNEEVGWQDDVTESTLDNQYNDWVVLRVDVTQTERDKAVSWASAQISAPFISMYPRLVAQVGSWVGLPLERDIDKYSWAGWLHGEEGF